MHYDIFISYRRATGKNFARIIKPELEKRGFRVFLDFDELKDGVFDKRIMDAIKDSPIFLMILSKGALDRCANEGDWVREEILYASEHDKHIVPVEVDKSFREIPEGVPQDVRNVLGAHQFSQVDTESLLEVSMEKLVRERISPHLIEAEKKRKAEAVALRKRERQESIRNMYMRINSWLRGHYKMILLSIVVLLGICMIVIFWSRATSPSSNLDLKNDSTSVGNQEVVNVITDKIVNDSLVVVSNAPEGRGHYKYSGCINLQSNLPEGYGVAQYDDGAIYEGHFKDGLSNDTAVAVLKFKDGTFYKGTFSKGYYVEGVFTYEDKSYYKGTYKVNKKKEVKKDTGTYFSSDGKELINYKNGESIIIK